MKKLLVCTMVIALVMGALFAGGSKEPVGPAPAVEAAVKAAASMSWDELLKKAQQEIGNEPLVIYATTSRPSENTFTEKTGIKVKVYQPTDSEVFEVLENEVGAGIYGSDVVLTTDSYNLVSNARENHWLVNYVPNAYKAQIAASDQDPLVCIYYNRAFIYNNGGGALQNYITNIWQLTEEQFKGIEIKSPLLEKCSMNWLITMTSPQWQKRIADAYQQYYGKSWQASGTFTSASYEWIYKFIKNCTFISKDGTIASNIASGAPGSVGLFTFSKFRSVDYSKLSVVANDQIVGFAGQLYPIYIQVTANAKYPYAASLYINYLLGEEGYMNVFGKDMGAYSANSSISISDNARSVGDQELSFWLDQMVVEDAQHIASVYAQAYTRIAQWCANK